MKITGDEELVAYLKEVAKKNKGYLKFLVMEARSNADLTAPFKGPGSVDCRLRLDRASGNLVVEKAG